MIRTARCILGIMACALPLSGQQLDSHITDAFQFRFIGPNGNRTIAVAGVPGDPLVSYIGAASGGVWKTEDGGTTWRSIFDDHDVSSVGSIAIADADPNVVYVGTGETFVIRPAHSVGTGVYRSTDAGRTWEHLGLDRTGRIGRMLVDPRDPDVAFACALGHTYGPQPERGVYRTRDGGGTWELMLHVDEDTGCSDMALDPGNPRVVYAAMWQVNINTWGLNSGGPGSGVWKSTDGGDTWHRLGNGLPGGAEHPVGKVAVAVAASRPDRVYVLVEDSSPGLYRSDDAGGSWRLVNQNHTMNERAPYYTRLVVAPDDPDEVYFISVRFSQSLDGGLTLVDNPPRGGGDTHDMWIDPTNPDRYMVADDGGANLTLNRGRTFHRVVPPVAQMYHVAVDNQIPYYVYGNRQDGYSYRGPSNSRSGSSIPLGLWHDVGGCESGFAQPDPVDNNIVWSGCYDGGLDRYDLRTGQRRNVRVWPEAAYGWAPADLRYRWHWNFPMHISPHDHNRVYVGSQYVHVTTDGGQSWREISPDLTLNLKDHQQSSGGIAIDNLMTFDGSVLFAIAESPLEDGLLWVGSNDGQVQVTRDGGTTWVNVTDNIPDLPPWGTIANVEPSRFDSGTVYIAVDLHQMGDFDPYIYKGTDYGARWERIDGGIPRSMLSFVHVVREDPTREGMLYAGTDNAVWITLDDGERWARLGAGLPPAPVYWLTVQEHFGDLVVATYGRGFYILDDLSALRALDTETLERDVHLFAPRPAYRFQPVQGIKTEPNALNTGRNPPYGAAIAYLVDGVADHRGTLNILDASGAVIRTLPVPAANGLHRTWWDLRHEAPERAKLRTAPPGKPFVTMGPEGWRPIRTWDLDINGGFRGPLAPPGEYRVRLTVGEHVAEQRLTVLKDPHSAGTEGDIAAQVAMSLELRAEINEVVGMVDEIEWLRHQLETAVDILEDDSSASDVVEAARALEARAIEVEHHLFDIHLTGAREDAFRNPIKLYGRLGALASDVGANGADFRPTAQQRAVHAQFKAQLEEYRQLFRRLMTEDVAGFKQMLRVRDLPTLISFGAPPEGRTSLRH